MKKWRNIKDNFVKASKLMKNKRIGSAAKRKSPYVYYNLLLFLKDSTSTNETELDSANDASQSHDESFETQKPKRTKKSQNEDFVGEQLTTNFNENSECRNETDNDYDKLFFLSLLGEFKKYPNIIN